jgi:ATP-dependent Clp protease ATP-binding subunit ClpA
LKPINAEDLQELVKRLVKTFEEEIYEDLSYINIKKDIEAELEQYIMAIRLGSRDIAFSSLKKLSDKLAEKLLTDDQFHKLYMEIINLALLALDEDGFKLEEELREEYLKSFIDLYNSADGKELMRPAQSCSSGGSVPPGL